MMYKLVTTNGEAEVTLSLQFGSITVKNGLEVPESHLTKTYPNLFYPIPTLKNEKLKTAEITIAEKSIELQEPPVKRKPGRPFSKNKKG